MLNGRKIQILLQLPEPDLTWKVQSVAHWTLKYVDPIVPCWADLLTAARVKSLRAKALIIALKTAIKRLENQDRSVSRYVSLWFFSSLSLNPSM